MTLLKNVNPISSGCRIINKRKYRSYFHYSSLGLFFVFNSFLFTTEQHMFNYINIEIEFTASSVANNLMPIDIQLRPINESDLPFLYTLYAGTREEELKQTNWNDDEKTAFLKMQFNAQHSYYQQIYAGEQFSIIMFNNIAIGRLYIGRWADEIRIIDITILPQYRRQGFGHKILQDIIEEARQNKKFVSLHVENNNPALSLYSRLGFQEVEDKGFYKRLEWAESLKIPAK